MKNDPESSLAEDRAFERWHNDTSTHDAAAFFRAGRSCEGNPGALFTPLQLEIAFREGFRTGREHPKRPTAREIPNGAVEMLIELKASVEHLRTELARLDSEVRKNDDTRHFGEGELRGYVQVLGRSEMKLRGRIEALETRPEPDHRGRFMQIERRLDALEARKG